MTVQPTEQDLLGLAAKLEGLDLTEAEAAILDGVLDRAAAADDDEVSGFKYLDKASPLAAKATLIGDASPGRIADKLGGALGWSWGETNTGTA